MKWYSILANMVLYFVVVIQRTADKGMGTYHNCENILQKYILALILTINLHIHKRPTQVCLSFDNPISFKLQISDDIHIC